LPEHPDEEWEEVEKRCCGAQFVPSVDGGSGIRLDPPYGCSSMTMMQQNAAGGLGVSPKSHHFPKIGG